MATVVARYSPKLIGSRSFWTTYPKNFAESPRMGLTTSLRPQNIKSIAMARVVVPAKPNQL